MVLARSDLHDGSTDVHIARGGRRLVVADATLGAEVTPQVLHEHGLVPKRAKLIELLGEGAISKALKITLHRVSNSAREKIEAAGGTITLIEAVAGES